MKETKPIKRSQQLAPLSREHHDALVFLSRIKQGLKNDADSTIICDYIHWFWNNNLKDHFEHEEELLLPHLPADDQLAIQLKNEHQTIRSLVSKELNKDQILQFADLLNAHIRFEERELFPHVEKRVSMQVLNEIFKKLDHPVQCHNWKVKFW